jgi:hypothetical protein
MLLVTFDWGQTHLHANSAGLPLLFEVQHDGSFIMVCSRGVRNLDLDSVYIMKVKVHRMLGSVLASKGGGGLAVVSPT